MSEVVTMNLTRERYLEVMDLLYFVDRRIDKVLEILESISKQDSFDHIPTAEFYSSVRYATEILQGTHDINL